MASLVLSVCSKIYMWSVDTDTLISLKIRVTHFFAHWHNVRKSPKKYLKIGQNRNNFCSTQVPSLTPFIILSLKLECEKLASEKMEIQRHYVMVIEDALP